MKARGKNGYVALLENGYINKKIFLSPSKRSGYNTSAVTLTFNIQEDGIYQIVDANYGSSKRSQYFILVKNGEILIKSENLNSLIIDDETLTALPSLEGTQRQIDYAENIRNNLVADIIRGKYDIPDWIYRQKNAKFYIENKEKFSSDHLNQQKLEAISGNML